MAPKGANKQDSQLLLGSNPGRHIPPTTYVRWKRRKRTCQKWLKGGSGTLAGKNVHMTLNEKKLSSGNKKEEGKRRNTGVLHKLFSKVHRNKDGFCCKEATYIRRLEKIVKR